MRMSVVAAAWRLAPSDAADHFRQHRLPQARGRGVARPSAVRDVGKALGFEESELKDGGLVRILR
jgi:hypothetical protein